MSSLPDLIDCQYLYPKFAASYLLKDQKTAAFVETNTTHSLPYLLNSLKQSGLTPEQVQWIIITHVHLDHAGGSFALMNACPNAVLLAHPRAVPHLVDPSKLVASAKSVYGESAFQKLYGEILPIESSRVRAVQDEEDVFLGNRKLHFFHTRGHANHHFCIYDFTSQGVFTGDSFGLAYPALQRNGLFIFPSTSPTDFDPEQARISIQKILDLKPEKVYLTHFGENHQIEACADQLLKWIDVSEKILNLAIQRGDTSEKMEQFCESQLKGPFTRQLEALGMAGDSRVWELLKLDIELNAAGIGHVARKRLSRL